MKMKTSDNDTGEAIFQLRGVSRTYTVGGNRVDALKPVTLEIASGEVVSLEGPSGSGKSTLLLLLGCLDTPTEGTIILSGRDLSRAKDVQLTAMRRDTLGYVFQQFNLIPTLNAVENVVIAMNSKQVRKDERTKRAKELLEQVGLGHRFLHLPSTLSGGEQQRVAIARALANRPSVIVADEPTGNLDSKSAGEIISLLIGLRDTQGVTVVIATHDDEVSSKASRRLKMRDGEIVSDSAAAAEDGVAGKN